MTEMTKRMILFSGSVNPELAEEIAKYLNVNLGNIKHEKFANGEIYARYQESIRGADVFLIQSVCASETFDVNDALMELLIMADAAKRASARSISAVIAHYGYARQDRKAAPREPITAKLVADLLEVSGIDNIITVDLHQDAIQGFVDIPVNPMTAKTGLKAGDPRGSRAYFLCSSMNCGRASSPGTRAYSSKDE